jgi:hypothetical protein
MAKTAEQQIDIKNPQNNIAFPVASGSTIYKGTFAVIDSGYLENLSSSNYGVGSIVGVVNDGSDNASGPAATTAAGSISGSAEETSVPAGDKTVRNLWLNGVVRVTGAGFAQTSVGKVAYLTDNYTANITGTGIKLGTIVQYISSTVVYVDMNKYYNNAGVVETLIPITAATTTTGGDCVNWSPGAIAYVLDVLVDVTTPATGAATADIGYAATGTSDDKFLDGIDIGTAAIFTSATQQFVANTHAATGNSAGAAKLTAAQFVTMTPSATAAGLVGTMRVIYIYA